MLEALKYIIPALGGAFAAYLGYKVKMRNTDATVDASAVQGWRELAEAYASKDRAWEDKFQQVAREIADLRSDLELTREKVRDLEQQRDEHRFWRRVGVDYIKALLAVLALNNVAPPPPPAGLKLD